MSTFTNKVLFNGSVQLGVTATTLYTAPALTSTIITSIRIVNTSTTNRTVTVYLVPAAGSATDLNTIIPTVVINANGIMTDQSAFVIPAGAMIQAKSDAISSISMYVSGVEIV